MQRRTLIGLMTIVVGIAPGLTAKAEDAYIVPAVNPDAVHHFMTEPHNYWRPRFNYQPHDRDGRNREHS